MNKIPVWIDTDTGVDDAVALITAVSLKELDISKNLTDFSPPIFHKNSPFCMRCCVLLLNPFF